MRAKTTPTGQKIVTRQTRIADPWSSVHSSQQHEILSKSIAGRHVAILHLIWQWVLKEDLWGQKMLFTDEGGKVVWWQGCLGQNSECSRPGAAGWWRRPSATTRWSAWTSSWRTARGNRWALEGQQCNFYVERRRALGCLSCQRSNSSTKHFYTSVGLLHFLDFKAPLKKRKFARKYSSSLRW